jgi:hypothetical protein
MGHGLVLNHWSEVEEPSLPDVSLLDVLPLDSEAAGCSD